jgi:hypothetical protein
MFAFAEESAMVLPKLTGSPRSEHSKPQKIRAAEALRVGGGIIAGLFLVFSIIGLDSRTLGTRPTAVPGSCVKAPQECWDAISKANGGIMCPVMYQDTYIRGQLVKAGALLARCPLAARCLPAVQHFTVRITGAQAAHCDSATR